jgi:hypothetical protein
MLMCEELTALRTVLLMGRLTVRGGLVFPVLRAMFDEP